MNTNKSLKKTNSTQNSGPETAEVLYQKLGNKWYAFSLIQNEVFVGSIDVDAITEKEAAEITSKQTKARRAIRSGSA